MPCYNPHGHLGFASLYTDRQTAVTIKHRNGVTRSFEAVNLEAFSTLPCQKNTHSYSKSYQDNSGSFLGLIHDI